MHFDSDRADGHQEARLEENPTVQQGCNCCSRLKIGLGIRHIIRVARATVKKVLGRSTLRRHFKASTLNGNRKRA
jgi:hypothetical protein